MKVVEAHPFHVTRDAEVAIKELEAEDLLETIEAGLRDRRFGDVVRLKVTVDMPEGMLDILMSNLEVQTGDLYRVHGPLSLTRLMGLYAIDRPDLKYPPFVPALPPALQNAEDEDMFASIRRQDILLHHPFDSFQPVIDFVRKAAHDPNVLAIKMTLYRVGRNSPIVEALLEAQEEGKQVAVLVELKARFDEESNIEWARALEREGRARGLRLARTEDPLQGLHGGPPRSRRHPAVRPPLHRQLQRRHSAPVHRYRHVYGERADRGRCNGPLQLLDRILRQEGLSETAGRAGHNARRVRGA